LDIQSIVAQLKNELVKIGEVIGLLETDSSVKKRRGRPPASTKGSTPSGRGARLSPAGRQKSSKPRKRRQTRRNYQIANLSPPPAAKPKKQGGMSAAGRKNISEAMKKRWAEKKRKLS
jgi:hypothetical protein